MKEIFSRQAFTRSAEQCLKRFPATVGFVALLSAFLLYLCWDKGNRFTSRQIFTIDYYLTVGCVLTLSLQLWGEEVKRKYIVLLVNLTAHAILIADAFYLYRLPEESSLLETGLAHGAALTALGMTVFTFPFFREKDDIASWNFALRLLNKGSTSWLVGGIMCGGLSLLTASLSGLFDIEVDREWYLTWLTVFGLFFPALMFLGQLPADTAKHDRTAYTSSFLDKVIRYLFLPLLGCYLAVLYVYAFKILYQWQLPNGWVSWLVTVLVMGCIGIEFCLYPSLRQGQSVLNARIARGLPVAILPLLVLMSIGIVRRLNDYGITLNRLYLLTLNIWYYLVCIGLVVSRAKRIHWIALSFAFLFLLTSVFPLNYVRFTHDYLRKAIASDIEKTYPGKLPMGKEQYVNWLSSLPQKEALLINSRFRYLANVLEDKHLDQFIDTGISYWNVESIILHEEKSYTVQDKAETATIAQGQHIVYRSVTPVSFKLDLAGNSSFLIVYHNVSVDIPCQYLDSGVLPVPLDQEKQPSDTVCIRMDDIRKWSATDFAPHDLPCLRKGNRFILTGFLLSGYAGSSTVNFTYSGYYQIQKRTN